MGLSMKTKFILFALYSLIFVTSVVSYYGFKGSQDSKHYLTIHSGNINLQVKNEGYHRVLRTTITADYETSNRKDCAITLRYDFPADIYVDKYELATIALNRKVEFYIDNKFIDVETPAHKSDPFVLYFINYTLPDTANKLIETEFPIHLRYQKAAEDTRYKEVRFGDAYSDVQMLYLCKGSRNSNWKQFPLNSGVWIPASYVKVNKDVVMYVPVGDTNNLPWVTIITHGFVLLGTYYILRSLMTTPTSTNTLIIAFELNNINRIMMIKQRPENILEEVKLPRTGRNTVKYKGDWNNLPDLLLENIFSFLDIGAKHNASKTCKLWYSTFHLPYSWHTFVFDDTTLTRRKFNYYSGWQYMLDHLRVQLCLQSIGRYVKVLVFKPITNFYNLYEFMNMISFYAEHGQGIGSRISTLQYTFPCNMATSRIDESVLYGTGGKLLEALKRLMGNLPSLERLELIDLMLDNEDAQTLLDQVCFYCCTTLKTLVLVNTTKYLCQMLHPGAFINLQVLVISPQNLGSDLLLMLSQIRLSHLHILQNRYTPIDIEPMDSFDWKHCVKTNATLKVHLRVESTRERQILWQPSSPVSSIIFKSPNMRMTAEILNKAIELYSDRLLTFGYLELPKFYQPSSFKERIDTALVKLIQVCPKLDTLMIREKISTCTLLLISYYGHSLKFLHVRRNAVILRCDWPRQNDWSDEFYQWLKKSSTSYEIVEEEIALSLGLSKWTMLNDRDFKRISPQLYSIYYK